MNKTEKLAAGGVCSAASMNSFQRNLSMLKIFNIKYVSKCSMNH